MLTISPARVTQRQQVGSPVASVLKYEPFIEQRQSKIDQRSSPKHARQLGTPTQPKSDYIVVRYVCFSDAVWICKSPRVVFTAPFSAQRVPPSYDADEMDKTKEAGEYAACASGDEYADSGDLRQLPPAVGAHSV